MPEIIKHINHLIKLLYEPVILYLIREYNDSLKQHNVPWRFILYGGAAIEAYFPSRRINNLSFNVFDTGDFDVKLVPLRVRDNLLSLEDANNIIYDFFLYVKRYIPNMMTEINNTILKNSTMKIYYENDPFTYYPSGKQFTPRHRADTLLYAVLYKVYDNKSQYIYENNILDISYMTIERLDNEHKLTSFKYYSNQVTNDIIVPYILYENVPLAGLGEVLYSTSYMLTLPDAELKGRRMKYLNKYNSLISSLNYFNDLLSCDVVKNICNRCFDSNTIVNKNVSVPYHPYQISLNYLSNTYKLEYKERLDIAIDNISKLL